MPPRGGPEEKETQEKIVTKRKDSRKLDTIDLELKRGKRTILDDSFLLDRAQTDGVENRPLTRTGFQRLRTHAATNKIVRNPNQIAPEIIQIYISSRSLTDYQGWDDVVHTSRAEYASQPGPRLTSRSDRATATNPPNQLLRITRPSTKRQRSTSQRAALPSNVRVYAHDPFPISFQRGQGQRSGT